VEGSPGYVYAAQGWGNMIGASIAGQKCLSYYTFAKTARNVSIFVQLHQLF
jgi:hypothetical protein